MAYSAMKGLIITINSTGLYARCIDGKKIGDTTTESCMTHRIEVAILSRSNVVTPNITIEPGSTFISFRIMHNLECDKDANTTKYFAITPDGESMILVKEYYPAINTYIEFKDGDNDVDTAMTMLSAWIHDIDQFSAKAA